MAAPKVKPLDQLRHQYVCSIIETAALLSVSDSYLYDNLVDENRQPIKASEVPPDGLVWIRFDGELIAARKGVNGALTVRQASLEAALGHTPRLHPAGADR
jgi:hypothetical protein